MIAHMGPALIIKKKAVCANGLFSSANDPHVSQAVDKRFDVFT
jgi:hypothetical protein